MKHYLAIHKIAFLLFSLIVFSGCANEIFTPAAKLEIIEVVPYETIPEGNNIADIEPVELRVILLDEMPCSLESYSIKYYTQLGHEIHGLAVGTTRKKLRFAGAENEELSVSIRAYTQRLMDLYEQTDSEISPVEARIKLLFKDFHSNLIEVQASCLLYRPRELLEDT